MTTKKIYGPWIKWNGGECPVPRDQEVMVKLRSGFIGEAGRAVSYLWAHHDDNSDIVKYRTVTEQPDLEAAENLLLANDYTVIPPSKPLTFKDVTPMTEAPQKGTWYWVLDVMEPEGVASYRWCGDKYDELAIKRRMAYLDREHALIAARHIFGLKGGEL